MWTASKLNPALHLNSVMHGIIFPKGSVAINELEGDNNTGFMVESFIASPEVSLHDFIAGDLLTGVSSFTLPIVHRIVCCCAGGR